MSRRVGDILEAEIEHTSDAVLAVAISEVQELAGYLAEKLEGRADPEWLAALAAVGSAEVWLREVPGDA